ncbi:MAG: hypothetical protein ACM3NV_06040 [Syntrophothermus sp.]
MPEQKLDIHIADVRVLKRGYAAACGTCSWVGPVHEQPDPAVEEARAHEADPRPKRPQRRPGFQLRRIYRRL